MGANASTPAGDGSRSANGTSAAQGPDDFYELLGVDVEATYDEIRKGFRREALKWHPDKNAGSDDASRRFVKIQAAYDVLSDNQERAYYDAHRGDIGQGDLDESYDLRERAKQAATSKQAVRITAKHLMRFFDASLWNGDFSDDANGFYGIYRTLFETISQSEYYATAPHGEPALSSPPVHYPTFGLSTTSYDDGSGQLKQFYNAYLNFVSRRAFNEVDLYKLQDAPDRRIKRLMEKENKRARDDARKEYNDAVRSVAAFVKKRDPRFLNSTSSDPLRAKQLERQKLQAQLKQASLEAARAREASARAFVEQDWQRPREAEESESDSVASDSQAGNENEMTAEGNGAEEAEASEEDAGIPDWYCPACEKDFASQGAWDNHERSRKHVKNMEKLRREMQAEEFELSLAQDVQDDLVLAENKLDDAQQPAKLSKKEKKKARRKVAIDLESAEEVLETVAASGNDDEPGLQETQVLPSRGDSPPIAGAEPAAPDAIELPDGDSVNGTAEPQLSKRDKRRAKEAAKKASGSSTPAEICNVCDTVFSSRSKLFDHIKATGHARAAPEDTGKSGKKGKRK